MVFLAVDANFHMKLKNCGIDDPEIGSGWSYFVEKLKYSEHVSRKTVKREVSSFQPHYGQCAHALMGLLHQCARRSIGGLPVRGLKGGFDRLCRSGKVAREKGGEARE